MKIVKSCAALLLFVAGLARAGTDELATFAKWLPGTYSSAALARSDPSRSDVRIHIVPIWAGATDGPWFYLEQAEVAKLDKPYRQAVLHVVAEPNGTIRNENWEISDKASLVGAWHDPALLARLTRERITASTGAVYTEFHRAADGSFAGGTPTDRQIPNHYKDAATFTNVSILTATTLYTWDRGWRADGTLAWGPDKSGYLFNKVD